MKIQVKKQLHVVTRTIRMKTNCKVIVVKVRMTRAEAQKVLEADMDAWEKQNKEEGIELDRQTWSAHYDYDTADAVQWDIGDADVPEELLSLLPEDKRMLGD